MPERGVTGVCLGVPMPCSMRLEVEPRLCMELRPNKPLLLLLLPPASRPPPLLEFPPPRAPGVRDRDRVWRSPLKGFEWL